MNPLIIAPLLQLGSKLIDSVFPNQADRDKAKLELLRQQQEGELKELEANLQLAMGQIEVNKAEASSLDNFRAGWRPAVGWVCAGGLAYQFIIRPLASFVLALNGVAVEMPALEMDTLMTLLFGLLGLGTLRTVEKVKGAA